jgi:acyl carrier protein
MSTDLRRFAKDELLLDLQAIWCEMLGVERVGSDEQFFSLGGDSMLMIRMLVKVSETFKITPNYEEFFAHPSLNTLAHLMAE